MIIKNLFELRVLIRRPFIENVYRTIFEIGDQQRKTLALSLRKGGSREMPVLNLNFTIQLKLNQIVEGFRIQFRTIDAEEIFKQVEIGKDDGKMLAIALYRLIRDRFPVEGPVESEPIRV